MTERNINDQFEDATRLTTRFPTSELVHAAFDELVNGTNSFDLEAEKALLIGIWVDNDLPLLCQLQSQDFYSELHRYVLTEMQLMTESNYPFGDGVALMSWFRQPGPAGRGERVIPHGETIQAVLAAMLQFFGEHGTTAHNEFYFKQVRKHRIRRAVFAFAVSLLGKMREHTTEPWVPLGWMQEKLNKVWDMAYETFPEEMDRQ